MSAPTDTPGPGAGAPALPLPAELPARHVAARNRHVRAPDRQDVHLVRRDHARRRAGRGGGAPHALGDPVARRAPGQGGDAGAYPASDPRADAALPGARPARRARGGRGARRPGSAHRLPRPGDGVAGRKSSDGAPRQPQHGPRLQCQRAARRVRVPPGLLCDLAGAVSRGFQARPQAARGLHTQRPPEHVLPAVACGRALVAPPLHARRGDRPGPRPRRGRAAPWRGRRPLVPPGVRPGVPRRGRAVALAG